MSNEPKQKITIVEIHDRGIAVISDGEIIARGGEIYSDELLKNLGYDVQVKLVDAKELSEDDLSPLRDDVFLRLAGD
jgi:hypothetical protein